MGSPLELYVAKPIDRYPTVITHPSRLRAVRLIAGYGAIASALPYLALKLVWLSGGTAGVADRSMMRETSMVALNAITAGMDIVGVFLALAFTHRWGFRIPAWLLLPPMWVATGLLATFVVGVPITAILSALGAYSPPSVTSGPVEAWVYVLVYIEFAGLGTGLMLAFLLYARERWAEVFQPATHVVHAGATHRVQVVLANAVAPAAVVLGLLHLAWAFGATVGLAEAAAERRTIIGSLINSIHGVMLMAAATGVLMMVHRIGETLPAWLPLAMAWTGTGALFGWNLWRTINVLGETALMRGAGGMAFVNLVGLLGLIVGLVLGLLSLFVLAERHESTRTAPGGASVLD